MTDWNPSEIIGSNPNNLDYSLYDYLIMNDSWHKGRQVLGYTKLQNSKLMRKFGNKPYVDVRASFNSLIPEKIDDKTKKKLLAYYFDILKTNPELHDKVEFKILFTCYDFSIEKRLRKLSKYGFTNNEIQKLKSFLESFTHEIIKKFSHFESDCNKDLDLMIINRKKINDNLQKSNEPFELLVGAKKLLDDCKKYGTTQFSTMARIGFIGTILLESLVEKKIISNIQEIKSRKGKIIVITDSKNDKVLKELANDLIVVPKTNHYAFVILASIVLQLLAYHIALGKKLNVDQPRNLAKSVSVE